MQFKIDYLVSLKTELLINYEEKKKKELFVVRFKMTTLIPSSFDSY